jgi:hypothetical protein
VDTLKVGAWDPAFHYDEDKNKLYLYWGSSNEWPLLGTEVKVKPSVRRFCKTYFKIKPEDHGWERLGNIMIMFFFSLL